MIFDITLLHSAETNVLYPIIASMLLVAIYVLSYQTGFLPAQEGRPEGLDLLTLWYLQSLICL